MTVRQNSFLLNVVLVTATVTSLWQQSLLAIGYGGRDMKLSLYPFQLKLPLDISLLSLLNQSQGRKSLYSIVTGFCERCDGLLISITAKGFVT